VTPVTDFAKPQQTVQGVCHDRGVAQAERRRRLCPEIRAAERSDAAAIAAIHNEAVAAGNATLRTQPRSPEEVEGQLGQLRPFLVAEEGERVLGWASAGPYEESNPHYSGVREVAIYIASSAQRNGVGLKLLRALAAAAREDDAFKLVAKVFTSNLASLELFRRAGYSVVGTHARHGKLRGEWKDVVVLELFLEP
jgi:L-amino acid N-acyltransferase YncA